MLSELVTAARRFTVEGSLAPIAMKPKQLHWIIELPDDGPPILKEYSRDNRQQVYAPDRQRSGQISPTNLKPYLLVDNARYALGIAKPGNERVDELAHGSFISLLREAYEATKDDDLIRILDFLHVELPDDIQQRIQPEDLVTFQCHPTALPFEREAIQRFWAERLAVDLLAPGMATCAVCGQYRPILRVLPNEVVVMGQKCQVTSFNQTAFVSFGKSQTTNAPLCYSCATSATQALSHLLRTRKHHAIVAREETKGQPDPLRNQLAVFWLNKERPQPLIGEIVELDIEDEAEEAIFVDEEMLSAPAREEDRGADGSSELAQLDALLRTPWTGKEHATLLSTTDFHLAVLSANKGRLLVRDWISVSIEQLRDSLRAFLQALRIIEPLGVDTRIFTIPTLTAALNSTDPGITRGLLRTAYLGTRPPDNLGQAALLRFRLPAVLGDNNTLHVLAAILKLSLTYGKEDTVRMEVLDMQRDKPAYLCGRLLAILEEAQRRASRGRIKATLVDRYYGAASTAPAATLGLLQRLSESAHLPKIRKEGLGYKRLQEVLQEVMGGFDKRRGIPRTLRMDQQADFALGFYHQRAAFHTERVQAQQHNAQNAVDSDSSATSDSSVTVEGGQA